MLNRQNNDSARIALQETHEYVGITLRTTQYQPEKLTQYRLFLGKQKYFMEGEILSATEKELVIRYQKEKGILSLSKTLEIVDDFQRLLIAQRIGDLSDLLGGPIQPYLHPDNIFLFGEKLILAHRGFMQAVVPHIMELSLFFCQYRALILAVLHPEADYELLIDGICVFQDAFSKKLQEAETFNEIHQLIGTKIIQQKAKRQAENVFVKKYRYRFYQWSLPLFMLLAIGFMYMASVYGLKKLPEKEQRIQVKTSFIHGNYSKVVALLQNRKLADLSEGTRYVLAASAVQLATLSEEQKKNSLNLLAQNKNDTEILCWIYIGRGELKKAVEFAKKSEDRQAALYVYTKLYEETINDHQIDEQIKQELLTEYEEAIARYSDLTEKGK